MNHDCIGSSLARAGYEVDVSPDRAMLTVIFVAGERRISIVHRFPRELLRPPKFFLAGGYDGKLAHVGVTPNGEPGEVCIGDEGSTAVNSDRPELVYLETVGKHVGLLKELIENPAHNRSEQLREFAAHWEILCRTEKGRPRELFTAWDGQGTERLQVRPARSDSGPALRKTPVALGGVLAGEGPLASVRGVAEWETRPSVGRGLAVEVGELEPAPRSRNELVPWYFETVGRVDGEGRRELRRLSKKGGRDYWLLFSGRIPGGETMFGIRWQASVSASLPGSRSEAEAGGWSVTPYRIRSLAPGAVVPRGGGSLDLEKKSVLLVGCGSVGGELAMRLGSAGVGRLTVCDPDTFSEGNLYRHVLSAGYIGTLKTVALAAEIDGRYPWAEVTAWNKRLEDLRDRKTLRRFDLVVIAVGSPTVERAFAEFCRRAEVGVPVVNCWLEGYGIGGHAILVLPGRNGCWHCAYVDPNTLGRGLTSNLNFLEPGQVVMRNHGGCGTQFLPYSGIAANYTATMTADLVTGFFAGEVPVSSKVSWIGSDAEARRGACEVTRRFRHFAESLRILPLHDENCDLCGG